jgi:hypothetical protein
MIGFQFKGVSYASNVFCQERQNTAVYHLKMVNQFPNLFSGTLILERKNDEFLINSPSTFDNKELIPILVDALKKQEVSEL